MKFEWDQKKEKGKTTISTEVPKMKKEYDFTNAEQGKFYRPLDKLDIPIYLDEDVKQFFIEKVKNKNFSLNKTINRLLKQEIEISKNFLAS